MTRRWRGYWETGGHSADWGCHLIDLLYFAFDMPDPEVITYTHRPSNDNLAYNRSTITSWRRASHDKFVMHYNDPVSIPHGQPWVYRI